MWRGIRQSLLGYCASSTFPRPFLQLFFLNKVNYFFLPLKKIKQTWLLPLVLHLKTCHSSSGCLDYLLYLPQTLWFYGLHLCSWPVVKPLFKRSPRQSMSISFYSYQHLIGPVLLVGKTFLSLLHCLSSLVRDQSVLLYGSISGISIFPGHGFKSLRC